MIRNPRKQRLGFSENFHLTKSHPYIFEMILDIPARRYETDVDVAVVAAVVVASAAVVVVDIAAVAEGLNHTVF